MPCFPYMHIQIWLTSRTASSSGFCSSEVSSFRTSFGSRSVYLLKTTCMKERGILENIELMEQTKTSLYNQLNTMCNMVMDYFLTPLDSLFVSLIEDI